MPTLVWILLWVLVIGVVAFFAVREIRSGRKGPTEVDRHQHQAVRDASARARVLGPTNQNTFGG
jgi:hypothetical protein